MSRASLPRILSASTIGISVAVPHLRLPHVLASAVGTLNQGAPGWLVLGLGIGFTAALTTGNKADSWATVREYVRVCRSLLAGQETQVVIKGEPRTIRHRHADHGYVNVVDPVPIYVSAVGTKGLRVTTEVSDGLYAMSAGQRPEPLAVAEMVSSVRRHANGWSTTFVLHAPYNDGGQRCG